MKKIYYITLLAGAVLLGSCNKFLDVVPDQRTELDSESKLAQLLVTAYPESSFNLLTEIPSDNITDNGANLSSEYYQLEELYLWNDVTSVRYDTPHTLWSEYYMGIATCNTALKFIEDFGNPDNYAGYKAEALMARAYCHFVLVNVFCHHYNEQTSTTDLGIPYMEDIETELIATYERGTVAEVYEKIDRDIEAALPYIDDSYYKVPAYRFNPRAAYAFAARFNLYYRKDMQKVVDYATEAIGVNPAKAVRDYSTYKMYSSWTDWGNEYVSPEREWNIMLLTAQSVWGRTHAPYPVCRRYTHSSFISNAQTYASPGIWEKSSSYVYNSMFGSTVNRATYPKIREYFVVTNPVNQTGVAYDVFPLFTTDETLLCRAEAYAHLGLYDEAMADLTIWNRSHGTSRAVNQDLVNELYGSTMPYDEATKKMLNPRFDFEKGGFYEALIHCILHTRRVETVGDGLRWFDIKRYGITVTHVMAETDPITLAPHDPRCAIQLPGAAIAAGMTPNPR